MMLKRMINLPKDRSFFLFGPRQTGKTTLLKQLFKSEESIYYDFLKTDECSRLRMKPAIFREEVLSRNPNKKYVIVDEVQLIPEILNEIHYLMESSDNPPIFIITGSSARKLKRKNANLLAGRAWKYNLHPLTHSELGNYFSIDKVMKIGSLPKVYLEEKEEYAFKTLKSYVETYLKEEISAESILRNVNPFFKFLPLAAAYNGNLLNFSSLSQQIGVSYKTVQEYFQILQDTLIGFMLNPFTGNIKKQIVKHPKFYFFDIGVSRAIKGDLSSLLYPGTKEYGEIFEHFIILEILRFIDYYQKDYKVSFYRTKGGAEVDLIIESQKDIFAIEIKSSDSPGFSDLKGLKSFSEVVPKAKLFCVSMSPRARVAKNIKIIPWREIFEHLGF
ncbi:MAG: ATP-binding protein [Elusimicrobia bacterium]|nr:ATP-binding protein [Elusimicrobiota bacterium]